MLRSFRINWRKNWVCDFKKWNLLWSNLQKDLEDLNNEMAVASFSFDNINSKVEEFVEKTGKYKRIKEK